jgi:hypothetical protein
MTYPFNPRGGLIVVETIIEGPTSKAVLHLALDMGATNTLINTAMLVAVGYTPHFHQTERRSRLEVVSSLCLVFC